MRPTPRTLLLGLAAALLATGLTVPAAGTTVPSVAEEPSPSALERGKALSISAPGVSCECGGAGYLWGWSVVFFFVEGTRPGHTYKTVVTGGGEKQAAPLDGVVALLPRSTFGWVEGRTYRFVVKEYKRKTLVRSTEPRSYTIPTPVQHPDRAVIDSVDAAGTSYLVAGRTHTVTFEGAWGAGVQFAKGVDRWNAADGTFGGYYEDEGYPLPWTEGAAEPALTLTPTEDQVGQKWNVLVVGSRPQPRDIPRQGVLAGDPVPGSEWGYTFFVEVISEEQAAELEG